MSQHNNFTQLHQQLESWAQSHYAYWQSTLYQQICTTIEPTLWQSFHQQPDVVRTYLQLICEGIAQRYITQASLQQKWHCFLEYLLIALVPKQLKYCKTPLQQLVKIWNLGENIFNQRWLDYYLISRLADISQIETLEHDLEYQLTPLLNTHKTIHWQAPFQISQLDCRSIHDHFLPGTMYLAAPNVVCIKDRRHIDLCAAIFVLESTSQLLALDQPLPAYQSSAILPSIQFSPAQIICQQHTINIPHLRQAHSHVVCQQGKLFVSAVDSQKIWQISCD